MTPSQPDATPQDTSTNDRCWNRLGVQGDRSCPRLRQVVHCRNCPIFSEAGQRLLDREAPSGYVDEWTRQLAQPDAPAAGQTQALLMFRLGAEWLALDAIKVVEVVEPRPIHRVPHRTDRLLLGLVNVRGELCLAVSLRELLGISESPGDATGASGRSFPGRGGKVPIDPPFASRVGTRPRFLVAEHNQDHWVFPVDEVEGAHRIPASDMEELPHTVQKSAKFYSVAVFSHDGKRVGVLCPTRLFQAMERIFR